MTRKSKRELERDVEQLAEDGRTPTREMSITRELVLKRSRAEREGREILGPADVAADGDFVRVDPYEVTDEEKAVLEEEFDVEPDTAITDSDR